MGGGEEVYDAPSIQYHINNDKSYTVNMLRNDYFSILIRLFYL
jgi:hypothetical protein